jgi:8-amino-7-oxononanoate synthase
LARDLPVYERISKELRGLRDAELWRDTPALSGGTALIDLSTNSYLGLHCNASVEAEASRLCGNDLHGNLASRLISEGSGLYRALEDELASWQATESALVFGSGYAANIGIIQSLCTRDTEVFCDRLNHASIIDGIQLARARLNRYAHCGLDDLKERLGRSKSREKVIITETVFSMDGDVAPIAGICELAKRHGALLIVDEAHATGVFGPNGGGVVDAERCGDGVDVLVGTFSKAVAGLGGFFAGSRELRDFFVNSSRSLIYSTGLPHSVLAWDLAAVQFIRHNIGLGRQLLDLAGGFRDRLRSLGLDTGLSSTQIVPCMVTGNERVRTLSRKLMEEGVKVPAIRSPTVPSGKERLRVSLHLGLTTDDLERVLSLLGDLAR